MSLCAIASNFGTDKEQAARDAERLSAALSQPVLLWEEGGNWWALSGAKAVGQNVDFKHDLITYRAKTWKGARGTYSR